MCARPGFRSRPAVPPHAARAFEHNVVRLSMHTCPRGPNSRRLRIEEDRVKGVIPLPAVSTALRYKRSRGPPPGTLGFPAWSNSLLATSASASAGWLTPVAHSSWGFTLPSCRYLVSMNTCICTLVHSDSPVYLDVLAGWWHRQLVLHSGRDRAGVNAACLIIQHINSPTATEHRSIGTGYRHRHRHHYGPTTTANHPSGARYNGRYKDLPAADARLGGGRARPGPPARAPHARADQLDAVAAGVDAGGGQARRP